MDRDPVVRWLLRAEYVAAFVAGVVIYRTAGGDLLFLVPLLLVPDISMVGYLVGPRPGSLTYNLVHNWAFGLAVVGVGWWLAIPWLLQLGGIFVAHVGMDRLLGYGLKYQDSFQDTHLGRIGRDRRTAQEGSAP